MTHRPADGERRAMGGYVHQYRVAASVILQSLREQRLQWVRVADPEAGRVDDFQIGSHSRVDAYQVKWSKFPATITFRDLTSQPRNGKPSLIAQLADGWRKLRDKHGGSRVVVHLVTNDTPSASDRLPHGDPPPAHGHFAAFVKQAWKPVHSSTPEALPNLPSSWQKAWDELQNASGVGQTEFIQFVRDCVFEFSYRLPEVSREAAEYEAIAVAETDAIAHFLAGTVADPRELIELSLVQLLLGLGWTDRYEFRSRHEFPPTEFPYQPIDLTIDELDRAISELPGGYLIVLGSPGSGKSTLLTETLRERPERVVKYYAFVPEAQDPATLRGESRNFFHDVNLALSRMGFSAAFATGPYQDESRNFHRQLQGLHDDWKATARKTLILIDGLDHIVREQHPQHSFLRNLPAPQQIPDGVYLILGSQTDELPDLPDSVQYAVRQDHRRIQIQPLSRQAVFKLVEQAELPIAPTAEQKEAIFILSAGHPLALSYLLKQVQLAANADAVQATLESAEPYQGDIEAQYFSHWRNISKNRNLVHFLGLLARIRRTIDIPWLERWADQDAIVQLHQSLKHYFTQESRQRWLFFHNSFRQFLIRMTATFPGEEYDQAKDRSFHRDLAEHCSSSDKGSSWAWEEIYHLATAEEHDAVLKQATQKWFREQLFALRPTDAVTTDIALALRSLKSREDIATLAGLVLASMEVAERDWYLKNVPLASLLLQVGEAQAAIEHIRDGNRLRIGNEAALDISIDLLHAGLRDEAAKVFKLGEPLDDLRSGSALELDIQREKQDTLNAWAEAAVHFRTVEEVISTARNVHVTAAPHMQEDSDTATRQFQNGMLFHAGLALLDEERWSDWARISDSFDLRNPLDWEWWFWLQRHSWHSRYRAGDLQKAKDLLEETLAQLDPSRLSAKMKTAIAEGTYLISDDRDSARKWIQQVSQPKVRTDIYSTRGGLEPFLQRFRLNRLLYALGAQDQAVTHIVPDADNPRDQGLVYFERAVCIVASIWGSAWRGDQMSPELLLHQVRPLLDSFDHRGRKRQDWSGWHAVKQVSGEFYELLIQAVAKHGVEALEALHIAFEEDWDRDRSFAKWPMKVRRQIILTQANAGAQNDWATQQLQSIEDHLPAGLDVSVRVEEYHALASAWTQIGNLSAARRCLGLMVRSSLGVADEKDNQMDVWVQWLGRINSEQPDQAAERIEWFSRAIISLRDSASSAADDAAYELLSIAFPWSPLRAVDLFDWFISQRVVAYEAAIRAILRSALTEKPPPISTIQHCLTDLVFPIAVTTDPELAKALVHAMEAAWDDHAFVVAVQDVLRSVQTWALPSTRQSWMRAIGLALQDTGIDAQRVGLSPQDMPDRDEQPSTSRELRLKDGVAIPVNELASRTVAELLGLLQSEADDSFFSWETVIGPIANRLSRDEIMELAAHFENRRDPSGILALLSERLSALGDQRTAWRIGEKALNASRSYGWSRQFDGGSRIAALRALVRADQEQGRELAYRTLIDDLADTGISAGNIALSLLDIWPLLSDELPVARIWPKIEDYVTALFENYELPEAGPTDIQQTPVSDTAELALARILVMHIDHPVTALAQAGQRAVGLLLLRRDTVITEVLADVIRTGGPKTEAALIVLDAVSSEDPEAVAPLRGEIGTLRTSPSYAVRRIVRMVCDRVACMPEDVSSEPIELPMIYSLVLPPTTSDIVSLEDESSVELLRDVSDPANIVLPFAVDLDCIATEAGLPKENLYYRTVQIMKELSSETEWSAEGENRLRGMLNSARLRLPFRRPRASLARRAMYYVVAELLDAGRLNEEGIQRLEAVFRYYDPGMVLREPVPRPDAIAPIPGLEDHYVREGWTDNVSDSQEAMKNRTCDGRVVLAEKTELRRLYWEMPTEVRLVVTHGTSEAPPTIPDHKDYFYTIGYRYVKEYGTPELRANSLPVIVAHQGWGYDSQGQDWLALNPAIGGELGWKLSEEGFFRWLDADGKVMVESIWWVDGQVDQQPPHFDDEVGQGWLVVAAPGAIKQIAERRGSLQRYLLVERRYQEQGGLPVRSESRNSEVISS